MVGIFPNRDSLIRLGGAILAERHDEWLTADHRYLPESSITRLLGGLQTRPSESSSRKASPSEELIGAGSQFPPLYGT